VIVLARDMMNRGATWTQVVRGLKGRFATETLIEAKEELRKLVAMDGLIGRVVIDGEGYENCSHALKAAENSPYKNSIRYVTGCSCGDPVLMESRTGHQMESVLEVPENFADAFFAAEDAPKPVQVPHCRSTMMPLLAAQGDLDQSEIDPTMIDLMNLTGLPEGETEKVMKRPEKGLKKWQHAFQMADKLRENQEVEKYAGPVDVSEHQIEVSDQEIELHAQGPGEIDVDPVNHALQQEVEPVAATSTNYPGRMVFGDKVEEIELTGEVDLSQLDVQLTNGEDKNSLLLAEEKEAPKALDVDERAAEVEPDIISFSAQEVEMTQFQEPEFEGVDDFELDAPRDIGVELDVNMTQNMTIE